MKKIIALILCFCLLGIFVPAGASGTLSVSTSAPQSVAAGQEIELVYTFSSIGGKGVCGVDLEISFDKEQAEFVSVTLEGFSAQANWTAAGRADNGLCMIHVFDDYEGNEPISIYQGTTAEVKVVFRTLQTAFGRIGFSTSAHGAVMGSYYENGSINSFIGTGNSVSVLVNVYIKDCNEKDFAIKNGVLYVLPGVTANDLPYSNITVTDANGAPKSKDLQIAYGDTLNFGEGFFPSSAVVLGDFNGDGMLTTCDYLLIKRHLSGKGTLTKEARIAADLNLDGVISVADAISIISILKSENTSLGNDAA